MRRSPLVAIAAGAVAFLLVSSYFGWVLVRPGRYRLMPWAHLAGVLAAGAVAVIEARRLARLTDLAFLRRVAAFLSAGIGVATTIILWGFVFIGSRLPDEAVTPPKTAPAIVLLDDVGEPVRLERRFEESPLVVAYYRGGFDAWARAALTDLERARPTLEAAGARVIVVGAESVQDLRAIRAKLHLDPRLTLLSDADLTAAKIFGVVHDDPRALRPATFVIARGGAITWTHVPATARDLPTIDALTAAVRAATP